MLTDLALAARRSALTIVVAGIATMGTVALAPTAAAAVAVEQDGLNSVVHTGGTSGPDAFILTEQGRMPVFFCDPARPMAQHQICLAVGAPTRF